MGKYIVDMILTPTVLSAIMYVYLSINGADILCDQPVDELWLPYRQIIIFYGQIYEIGNTILHYFNSRFIGVILCSISYIIFGILWFVYVSIILWTFPLITLVKKSIHRGNRIYAIEVSVIPDQVYSDQV